MRALTLMTRLRHQMKLHPMGFLSGAVFFTTFGAAIFDTIWAVFVDSYTHSPAITSLLLSGLSIFIFLCYLLFSNFVARREKESFVLSSFIGGLTFLLLPFVPNIWVLLLVALFNYAAFGLRDLGLGVLIRDASSKKTIAKNEGLKYIILNIAYIAAPLLMALIFDGKNYALPFIIAGLAMITGGMIVAFMKVRRHKAIGISPFVGFKHYWRSEQRTVIYLIRAGLTIYWAYVYLYIPLLLVYEGYPAYMIGLVLFLVAVPLVALEYFTSKAAPKIGFKKMFVTGFLICGTLLTISAFVPVSSLFFALIVGSSVGAALIEPTIEAYFFHVTKREDEPKYLGTYFTAKQTGAILSRLLGAGLVALLGLHKLALGFGLLTLVFAYVSTKVKH